MSAPDAPEMMKWEGPKEVFDDLLEARDEVRRWEEWSNSIAEQMPEDYDGDDAQEAIIDRWLSDLRAENERLMSWLTDANKVLVFADGLAVSTSDHALADLYAADCEWAQNALASAESSHRSNNGRPEQWGVWSGRDMGPKKKAEPKRPVWKRVEERLRESVA